MNEADLRKLVNASGFPLQVRLEDEILHQSKRWSVVGREVPWHHYPKAAHGFADLLATNGADGRLVIECKRLAEYAAYVFLVPHKGVLPQPSTSSAYVCVSYLQGSPVPMDWREQQLGPDTAESDFAMIQGQTAKDRPILERLGAELVIATEAIAYEERQAVPHDRHTKRLYCPVLVTTAELYLCRCAPQEISLDYGRLEGGAFEKVPYLRFRKGLESERSGDLAVPGMRGVIASKQRTVFVVNAAHIIEFLDRWDIW